MTDRKIIDVFNGIRGTRTTPGRLGQTVVEEPPGEKQIDYHENGD